MKLFFFRIGLADNNTKEFYEIDGDLECSSFGDAKLMAYNLGKSICNNNASKFDLMLTGTVVTEPYLQVE